MSRNVILWLPVGSSIFDLIRYLARNVVLFARCGAMLADIAIAPPRIYLVEAMGLPGTQAAVGNLKKELKHEVIRPQSLFLVPNVRRFKFY